MLLNSKKGILGNSSNISIISKNVNIEGNINSKSDTLEIEGHINGDINVNTLTLREDGNIKGNIIAKITNIKGSLNGTIRSEKVNVSKTANIKGTIEYVYLCVEDGAVIDADLKRITETKVASAKDLSSVKKV